MSRRLAPAQRIERTVAGQLLVVERHDPPEPEPSPQHVFLVHGMADTAATWLPLREHAPRAVWWTFEMPWSGRGGNDWPHRLTATDWWRAALACCPAEPDLCVGHSFGAMVLLDWLCGNGPRLAPCRLMLVAPYFHGGARDVRWTDLDHFAGAVPQRMAAALQAQLEPGDAPLPRVQEAMVRLLSRRILPDGLLEFFRLYLGSRLWDLRRLGCAADVLVGCDDEALVHDSAVALQRALPAGRLHQVAACGHYPMHEQPEALARALAVALEPPATLPAALPAPALPPAPLHWLAPERRAALAAGALR
ncbi:MAG: alpha/beta hydrolase [Piscinibacter sp.]|uniref:alpha/beta fold hydrolase n=1 Tax=Piscinibacter sp. TaxID=1903157 RepID=UPI002583D672|nr:alpha/beta hydrolase [Piscinibacter sp.]MCW5667471.1 alpha/beta hydrolase [Piscinibacter sp.]